MLQLIPRPVARTAYRLAHRARILWWRWAKPQLNGCRVIALDEENRVLLVRHTYGSGTWMPPGGGLSSREDAVAAACRELAEEVGLSLSGARLVSEVTEPLHGAHNRVRIVGGRVQGAPVVDRREVAEAGFFALEHLPEAMSPVIRQGLPLWVRAATAACHQEGDAWPRQDAPAPKG